MSRKETEGREQSPKIKESKLGYLAIEAQVKHIQGKILTIIDASYTDAVQRKAIKDLVNGSFTGSLNWLYDLTHPEIHTLGETEMVQVDVEETLESVN